MLSQEEEGSIDDALSSIRDMNESRNEGPRESSPDWEE